MSHRKRASVLTHQLPPWPRLLRASPIWAGSPPRTRPATARRRQRPCVAGFSAQPYTWVQAVIRVGSMTTASVLATSSRNFDKSVSRSASHR